MSRLDQTAPVRSGEELNKNALLTYLNNQLEKEETDLDIQQFPAGFSNLTYLIHFADQELVLRKPPLGAKIKSGHDMGREFRVLAGLGSIYHKIPKVHAYCDDPAVLGTPFYLMQRVRGIILRPKMQANRYPDATTMARISRSLVKTLVELHQLDYRAAGLADLGKPDGYVDRQVAGWTKRYAKSKTDHLEEVDQVALWLEAEKQSSGRTALIHNDFKYDNVILDGIDPTSIIAILDWEMCTLGDPLMDLGTTLGYWVNDDDPPWLQKLSLSPTVIPGNLSRSEFADLYLKETGQSDTDLIFYYVFGLFKIGVIVQQIYLRYQQGHTQDERFANLIRVVKGLNVHAKQVIDKGRLDDLY